MMRKLIIFVLLLLPVLCFGKKFFIDRVQIEAKLQSDGSMVITEERDYRFNGRYSYAFITRAMKDGEKRPVAYRDIHVEEVIAGDVREFSPEDSKDPYTFRTRKRDGMYEIRWYFEARNETRTFRIVYTVDPGIRLFEGYAEMDFQFIGTQWKIPQEDVTLSVFPPEATDADRIDFWVLGNYSSNSQLTTDGIIQVTSPELPRRSMVRTVALYPAELFADAPVTGTGDREAAVQKVLDLQREMEEERQSRIARTKRWDEYDWAPVALAVLGLLFWWYLFWRYGKRIRLQMIEPGGALPSRLSGPLVSYLLNGKTVVAGAFVSMLMDLARKDVLALEEEKDRKGKSQYLIRLNRENMEKAELESWERMALEELFGEIADEPSILRLKILKKRRTKFQKLFAKWRKKVREAGEKMDWFDRESYRGMVYSLIGAGVMMVLGFVSIWLSGPWSAALFLGAATTAILSIAIPHHNEKGAREAIRWRAYRKWWKQQSKNPELAAVRNWGDDLVVYGPALGFDEGFFKKIFRVIPSEELQKMMPWVRVLMTEDSDGFPGAIIAVIVATNSSVQSSSGAAGGASGGGAGGGGGGAG